MRLMIVAALCAVAAPAHAGELFGGVYVHDVKTPLTKSGIESGADIMAGHRWGRIAATPLQPYVLAAVHTGGKTSYAVAGVSAKFGDSFYVRPGFGLAVHSGSTADHELDRDGTLWLDVLTSDGAKVRSATLRRDREPVIHHCP